MGHERVLSDDLVFAEDAAVLVPRTHKIVIEEFCQMGRLGIKFGQHITTRS